MQQIGENRMRGDERVAEIARQQFLQIHEILLKHRTVEPHGNAGFFINLAACPVAHHGQDRIDRHETPDHEGDSREAEKSQRQRPQKTAEPPHHCQGPLPETDVFHAGYFDPRNAPLGFNRVFLEAKSNAKPSS